MAGLLLASGAAPVQAGSSQAQLLVTARVVNRCTLEVPPAVPRAQPAAVRDWRRQVRHECARPVRPEVTLRRIGAQPARPVIGRIPRAGHFLVTVRY